MFDQDVALYEERVPMAPWLVGVVGLALVGLVGSILGMLIAGISRSDRAGVPIALLVTGFVAFLFWNYRAIDIRVTPRVLEARYGLFNRKIIPFSDLESCRATTASFGRFLGVGVRMGLDGSWAYTTSFGPAIEVRRRSGKPFVISSNRSLELCQVINGALAR